MCIVNNGNSCYIKLYLKFIFIPVINYLFIVLGQFIVVFEGIDHVKKKKIDNNFCLIKLVTIIKIITYARLLH